MYLNLLSLIVFLENHQMSSLLRLQYTEYVLNHSFLLQQLNQAHSVKQ